MRSQPGAYALLLGSGISRSADIPTGWEVTLDLIRKLAKVEGTEAGEDPEDWFRRIHGEEPTYTDVVSRLAPTANMQQQLLRSYFEPSMEERERGLKRPTNAHRAIARLVQQGHFRVIVTTNFDRLMEMALQAEGIEPAIIQHADEIDGAPSFAHSPCTIIKVHGDYRDTRIRNSPSELDAYDGRMNDLLDRIFSDYGLVVCGWSAEYDTALRNAIRRARSRRYLMVWVANSTPKQAAEELIAARNANVANTVGADDFFSRLADMLESLGQYDQAHPISKGMLVSLVKKYLSEDSHRIRLRELFLDETEKTLRALERAWQALGGTQPSAESVSAHLKRLEGASDTLCSMFAVASYYGRAEDAGAISDAIKLLAGHEWQIGGWRIWEGIGNYPLLRILYAIGVSAVAADHFHLLAKFAGVPAYRTRTRSGASPIGLTLDTHSVLDISDGRKFLPGRDRHYFPLSDYLQRSMFPALLEIVRDANSIKEAFDKFEYLWTHVQYDLRSHAGEKMDWVPVGPFVVDSWGKREGAHGLDCCRELEEAMKLGADMPQIRGHLFAGSFERLSKAHIGAEEILKSMEGRRSR